MKRTKFFCATLFTVFALLALFSCSNPANTGTPGSLAKSRGAKIINVTYDANGGGQLNKSVYDYALGNPIGTEMPVARRAGYVFTGWNTKANGTGDIFNKNTILTDSITVYAQWTFKTAPFTIVIDYSNTPETIPNYNSLPDTATVALNNTQLTITTFPTPAETPFYDFVGYYDENGDIVCDTSGNLIPGSPYTDDTGKWTCDPDYEGIDLVIHPLWVQSIKATTVSVDQTTYNVQMGETFTVTGKYTPANATITITDPFEYYYDNNFLITKPLVCNNGTFSIELKALIPFSDSFTFKCAKYPSTTSSCTINASFPSASELAALPSVSQVSNVNKSNAGTGIGNSSSQKSYDFTGLDFDSDTVYKMYKVNLSANKEYIFEMVDDCSTQPDGIDNFIDACLMIYDASGNICYFDNSDYCLDDDENYFTPTSSGTYYIYLSRLDIYDEYEGYAGFHIYLNCATDINLNVQNDYDQSRYDSFSGTYKLKPLETLNLDVNYDYKCENEPVVWPEASIFNTSIISLDDTNIAPADGGYITLTANKIGSTDLVVSDNYSDSGIHYFVSCGIDGSFTTFDTASSTDYSDYTEMLFSPGLESVKWYKLSLTGGHRYAFETGNNVTEIVNAIGTPNRTYVDLYIYDSDFNLLTRSVEFFPCQETGDYYIQFRPHQNDRKNAFHVYDMGAINTSIALSSDNLNLNVGNSTTIAITFNNGGTALSSDFTCYFADGVENDYTDLTRFASVTPYDNNSDEITISGVPYGEFSFSDVPSTLTVKGLVPGKTKLIVRDDNAGIQAELNITVTATTNDGNLTFYKEPAASDTTFLSVFNYKQLSASKLYSMYSATLQEGVKYYFQTLDIDNSYGLSNGDCIDAHFYLLDSAYNIVAFSDSTQIIDYTCPASGTYYFVITYRHLDNADSDTGYAGVRWYAEKMTSLSDYLPSTPYFFLSADGQTHVISNDFPYTPADAYYDFTATTVGDSRILANVTINYFSRIMLNPYMPGISYVTVKDDYSGITHDYKFKVFPTEASSEIPVLPISKNPVTLDDSTEIYNLTGTVFADLSSKKYEIYSMNLSGGARYHFLLADSNEARGLPSTSDCYFYIENSNYDIIVKADNGSSDRANFLNFTCPESGTYYLVIARHTMETTGATTAGAVYAYYEKITAIDSANTISTINMPLGGTKTVTIPIEPEGASGNFTVKLNSTNSKYRYMLNFDEYDNISVSGNTFELHSLGMYGIDSTYNNNYKFQFDVVPVTITDENTGLSKNIEIHIIPDPLNTILVSPVPETMSQNNSDYYTSIISQTNPVLVYAIPMEAGKTYSFHNRTNTMSCFYLYSPSFAQCNGGSGTGLSFLFDCKVSGTYYITICSSSSNSPEYTDSFYVYGYVPVVMTSLNLSETSVTVQAGQTVNLNISYTPANAEALFTVIKSPEYGGIINSAYVSGNILTIKAGAPGQGYVSIMDSHSLLQKTCTIKVIPDLTTAINVSPGTTSSTNIDDYQIANLSDTTPYALYKMTLQAGKTYTFENVDSYSHHQIATLAGSGDCWFYLYDSTYSLVTDTDDNEITYSCTSSGIYYYQISRRTSGTIKGAVHVYGVTP